MSQNAEIICLKRECLNRDVIFCTMHPHNITPTSNQCDIQKCEKFISKIGV